MIWIYLSIAVVFSFLLFLLSNYSDKKFNSWRKNNYTEFVKKVRDNWKEIKIKPIDCIIINFDTKVDRNSATYSFSNENENENFFERISKDPQRVDLVDLHRTKILCRYRDKGEIIKEFSTIVDMDKTIVEFKLRLQDHISVYISNDFEEEDYFIDLEFLNDEIDFTKFR